MKRRWLANAAIVLGATLVPILIAEVALRATDSVPPGILETDSATLYRLVPNGRKTFVHRKVNGGGLVDVVINGDGFRGPPLRPTGSARRIVVYGDSFIEGEFIEDSLTFVRMLERDLGGSTEVVNAGVAGFGPDQEFRKMQGESDALKPSVVVFAFFADNDMGDLVRDRLYRVGANGAIQPVHTVLNPALRELVDDEAHPGGLRSLRVVRWVERKLGRASTTGLLPTIRQRGAAGGPALTVDGYADWAMANAKEQWSESLATDTVSNLLGDSYDVDVSAAPNSPSARGKVALMDGLLGLIKADLARRGIPLVIVIIPSPIDACETYDVKVNPARYPEYLPRRISGIVDSLAAKHQIRRIDLWSPFRATDVCALYYRGGDLHWKPPGQALAARLLADSLSAWGLARR